MALQKEGPVYILTLINGENANTITADVIDEYHAVLDKVESTTENASFLLTSDDPKFWSTGINLDWLNKQPPDYFPIFTKLLDELFLRFALLNMPTIACLTGHTFAASAIMACTFDFRLMREERGFFCFPEVDIKMPFTPIMYNIIALLPDRYALNELALTGKRIGGKEALALKVVSAAFPEDILLNKAMELATQMAKKDRKTYTNIKHGMRQDLFKNLKQNLKG
jgi:enoyl-CoA hydratase/carnithine racemase